MSGPWVNRLLAPPSLTKSPVIQPGSQPSFSISAIPPFRHTPAPAVRFKPCLSAEEIKVGGHLRPPIGASQRATLPAHDYFGQILDSDGTVLLCLYKSGAHEHPSLMGPDHGTPGNGLLLCFRVDDFDAALQRARSLSVGSKRSHTSIRTLERSSSRSEIRTDITLRSVRSLGAKMRTICNADGSRSSHELADH